MAAGLAGCADLRYYWQSVNGHMMLLNAARPVDDWLDDAQTPAALKTRLALAQRIRRFAVTELKLPDNPSYRRYADLRRSAVVWNVVAAPEFSLTLKTWCFPWPAASATGATSAKPKLEPRRRGWRPRAWRPACTACPPIPPWDG